MIIKLIKKLIIIYITMIFLSIWLQMAEIADWCLSEEAINRPEMREVVQKLSMIVVSSVEWEASLGGSSIFSGVFNGR
jgi:hypothetical protein